MSKHVSHKNAGDSDCRVILNWNCLSPFREMINQSDNVYFNVRTEAEEITRSIFTISGFICGNCRVSERSEWLILRSVRSHQLSLEGEISALKVEQVKLGAEFNEYRRSHPPPSMVWPTMAKEPKSSLLPSDTKRVMAAVHTELSEKQRRSRNVIVTGLVPCNDRNDVDLFIDLCENSLPVKLAIVRERCRRLGYIQQGKIRPLMITLTNECSTADLQHAKLLRRTCDGVYINPDLTPAEAQAAFERREQLRIRKAGANENTQISTAQPSAFASTSSHVVNVRRGG
jgi:hypothetical protein